MSDRKSVPTVRLVGVRSVLRRLLRTASARGAWRLVGTKNASQKSVVKNVNAENPNTVVHTLPTFSANPHSDRVASNDASAFKLTRGRHNVSSLVKQWEQLSRVVEENTTSGIRNFFANLFNRERKENLENLKSLLASFRDPNAVEQKDKWQSKLNDLIAAVFAKRLPKAVEDGVAALLKEAKNSGIEVRMPEIKDLKFKGKTELGRGGFGIIYKSDDGQFVIKKAFWEKVLNLDDEAECKSNEAVEGGLKKMTESKEYFCFQSRNFVTRYIGSMSDGFQRFPVFEYIEGKDLYKCIHGAEKTDSSEAVKSEVPSWELSKKMRVLSQMASGIAALHEAGCVNRDIKPANTMVFEKDGVLSVKLVDQGLTLDIKNQHKEINSSGTIIYQLPPKDENPSVSPARDVFSLGMSVAELATGGYTDLHFFLNNNHKGSATLNEATWNEALEKLKLQPPFIKELVKSCCAYKPEDRPSAAQVAYCLEVFSAYAETHDAKAEQETLRDLLKLYGELTEKYGEGFKRVEAEDIQKLETCHALSKKLDELKKMQPVFSDILRQAQADRPKSIPVTMRQLLQSDKPKEMKQGCAAILQLGKADASYRSTPSYGLALLRGGKKDKFDAWAEQWKADFQNIKNEYAGPGNLLDEIKSLKEQIAALREVHKVLSKGGTEAERVSVEKKLDEKIKQSDALSALQERLNQNPLFNLMQRITTDEISKDGNEVWGTKDIKVSREEYKAISEASRGMK